MTVYGIQEGDEVIIQVIWNRIPIGEISHDCISPTELVTNVYTEDESTVVLMNEAISASYQAMQFHMQKPRLKELLEERIAQLKAEEDDSEAGEAPSPTVHDIPF